jgi:hypothetical protein
VLLLCLGEPDRLSHIKEVLERVEYTFNVTPSFVLPIFSFRIMYIDVEVRFLVGNKRNDVVILTFQHNTQ